MKQLLKLTGCFTLTFTLIGLVYYIIMTVNMFTTGVDGGIGFLLIVGAIAIPIIGIGLGFLFFLESMRIPECGCKIEDKE